MFQRVVKWGMAPGNNTPTGLHNRLVRNLWMHNIQDMRANIVYEIAVSAIWLHIPRIFSRRLNISPGGSTWRYTPAPSQSRLLFLLVLILFLIPRIHPCLVTSYLMQFWTVPHLVRRFPQLSKFSARVLSDYTSHQRNLIVASISQSLLFTPSLH